MCPDPRIISFKPQSHICTTTCHIISEIRARTTTIISGYIGVHDQASRARSENDVIVYAQWGTKIKKDVDVFLYIKPRSVFVVEIWVYCVFCIIIQPEVFEVHAAQKCICCASHVCAYEFENICYWHFILFAFNSKCRRTVCEISSHDIPHADDKSAFFFYILELRLKFYGFFFLVFVCCNMAAWIL